MKKGNGFGNEQGMVMGGLGGRQGKRKCNYNFKKNEEVIKI